MLRLRLPPEIRLASIFIASVSMPPPVSLASSSQHVYASRQPTPAALPSSHRLPPTSLLPLAGVVFSSAPAVLPAQALDPVSPPSSSPHVPSLFALLCLRLLVGSSPISSLLSLLLSLCSPFGLVFFSVHSPYLLRASTSWRGRSSPKLYWPRSASVTRKNFLALWVFDSGSSTLALRKPKRSGTRSRRLQAFQRERLR